jgi:restriction endonuclease S subunit
MSTVIYYCTTYLLWFGVEIVNVVQRMSKKQEKVKNIKSLGDLAEKIFLGFSASRQPKMANLPVLPVVNIKDLRNDLLATAVEDLDTIPISDSSQTDHFRLRVGDVIISARGAVKVAPVGEDHVKAIAGPNLIVVRMGSSPVLAPELLLAFLRHPTTRAVLEGQSVGAAVPSINVRTVSNLRLAIPSQNLQSQLAEVVQLADEQYITAKQASEKRRELGEEIVMRALSI